MYYSIISCLALVLNIIINREALNRIKVRSEDQNNKQLTAIRYSFFLITASCYFITDIGWGLLYECHENYALFPFMYLDCALNFIIMFLTMLAWIRFIIAYLNKKGKVGKALLYAVWIMFTLALINLIINYFYPFIFYFNEAHEFVPASGRHIAFILQIAVYMSTSAYMFYLAHKTVGDVKFRHIVVGITCFVMELFLILQFLDPNYPFYAMGLIIGIGVIHSYVELGEKKEKEIYDSIARGLADDYASREELIKKVRDLILENLESGSGPILASGMAEFNPEVDSLVSDIFNRADKEMYENKQELKSMDHRQQNLY